MDTGCRAFLSYRLRTQLHTPLLWATAGPTTTLSQRRHANLRTRQSSLRCRDTKQNASRCSPEDIGYIQMFPRRHRCPTVQLAITLSQKQLLSVLSTAAGTTTLQTVPFLPLPTLSSDINTYQPRDCVCICSCMRRTDNVSM